MPNHVTTVVTVTGPDDELVKMLAEAWKDGAPDFESLCPMPVVLKGIVSGSDSTLGYEVLTRKMYPGPYFGFDGTDEEHLAKQNERFDARSDADKIRLLEIGQRVEAAIEETGSPDWYHWNCKHWGTKWPAYDGIVLSQTPGRLVARFDTAWSFPTQIFDRLAAAFPRLLLTTVSFDEGWNFACRGAWHGTGYVMDIEPTKAVYEEVYGEPPEEEEEEEDDDESDEEADAV